MNIRIFTKLLVTGIALIFSLSARAEKLEPYIYVLGVVQDAGYPHVGCYKDHCMPAWKNPKLRRGAVSLGLADPGSNKKYLFDASPDFPEQFYMLEQEAPSDRFELAGIFLTHAHIGHYTGLMFLGHEAMGTSSVPVYTMPRMNDYLKTNGPCDQRSVSYNLVIREYRYAQ